MKALSVIRTVIGCIGFPLTIWNTIQARKNATLPPGQIVRTKYSDLHVLISGDGPITVLLESGLSSISIDWCYIQPEISKIAKVVSYDRGNYGWSRTKRKNMTGLDAIEELEEMLELLNINGPIVLVGHSYGALITRLFASAHPEKVQGMILVDPAHEHYYLYNEKNKKRINQFKRFTILGYLFSVIGLPRLFKQKVGRNFLKDEYVKSLNDVGYSQGGYKSIYMEYRDSCKTAEQLLASRPLKKNLPTIILTADNQTSGWKKYHDTLSNVTNCTDQITVDSGHSIHLEDPEIVIESIKKIILSVTK